MPVFGTLDLAAAIPAAPVVDGLDPEPWMLPGAETLQVSFEVAEEPALTRTPPGLHPSIPPYATFSVCRFPESPVGPFTLAMVRLIVRAGIRPRGLLIAGATDSTAAADALRRGWGYDVVAVDDVSLSRRHDRIAGSVTIDGSVVLDAALDDPEPVAGSDLELFDNLHLVRVADDGRSDGADGGDGEALIVQVDPGYEYTNADRGTARLDRYDAAALGSVGIDPVYPVVAVACTADMTLGPPRFVIDPAKPAVQGTRRLDRSPAS
ncbi:MAG: hypothetical protein AAGA93_22065 [Actinomycetota bacterium]